VKRRWTRDLNAQILAAGRAGDPISVRICPACRQRKSGLPRGFVHVDGRFVPGHRDELERLLRNEVARATGDNPLGQVIDWGNDGRGGLVVTTTTEHLAIRLGNALERAYDGRVLFGFSHENKLAHVWWHRDAAQVSARRIPLTWGESRAGPGCTAREIFGATCWHTDISSNP
jgi:hypothetical protein